MHEARDHHNSIFATLTYDEAHVPGELVPSHLSEFLKAVRHAVWRQRANFVGNPTGDFERRVRYLACGEYGDHTGRPHYHAILFGVTLGDATRATAKLFNSKALESLWGHGTVNFGGLSYASAAYVAGYTVKSMGRSHCDADGVVKQAPFLRVSLKPGLGQKYALRYGKDFYRGVIMDGETPRKVPRYYKKTLGSHLPATLEQAAFEQEQRRLDGIERDPFRFSQDRLVAGQKIAEVRQQLTRNHTL